MSEKLTNKLLLNQSSEIQAMRKYLGLETKEAAELVSKSVRSWQYWEKGVNVAPSEVLHLMDSFCGLVQTAVDIAKDDDLTVIPYFIEYQDFAESFPDARPYKWQLWQRITGLIRINKYCNELSNDGVINIKWRFANHFIDYLKKSS